MHFFKGSVFGIAAALMLGALPASADPGTFPTPSGWMHVDGQPQSDPAHSFDTWKQSDAFGAPTLTVIRDATTSFEDAVSVVRKNFSDNHIQPSADADGTCRGKTSHVFEFAAGPDGHRFIINRTVVSDGTGVTTITYSRPQSAPFLEAVKTAITTFCGAAAGGSPGR
jgi:hypothetical protein